MKIKVVQNISNGIKVLKENPIIFIPALIMAIISIYSSFVMASFTSELNRAATNFTSVMTALDKLPTILATVIVLSLVSLFFGGIIIKMVVDSKKKISFGKVAKFVAGKYLTLLAATILVGIIVILGLIAFIIPGIFLFVKLVFYPYSILIGNKGIVDSLKESWKITKGNWWGLFLIVIIFGAISSIISNISNLLPDLINFAPIFIVALLIAPWRYATFTLAYIQAKK